MRLRLLGLLVAAGACTWLAAAVSAASPEKASEPERTIRAAPARPHSCPLPRRFRPAFERAAKATGVPLALLVAVARVEANATRSANQLTLDPDHPPSNVVAGARYLRLMLDRFHSADLALAAYNAGPTAVAKAGGVPSPKALAYVAAVTRAWRRLHACK